MGQEEEESFSQRTGTELAASPRIPRRPESLSLGYGSHLGGRIRRWEGGEGEWSSPFTSRNGREDYPTLTSDLSELALALEAGRGNSCFVEVALLTKAYAELSVGYLHL